MDCPVCREPLIVAERERIELDVCPWDGFWPFNPSVHRDSRGRWRCTVRCADYNMIGGSPVVPSSGRIQNRNLMVELDDDLEPVRVIEMRERFGADLIASTKVAGVEDLAHVGDRCDHLERIILLRAVWF